jgi:methionine-rich copper-binding protein CopC
MSVTTRRVIAWSAAIIVALLGASAVAADAEFVESDPAPGSEVAGPFDGPISLTFDEPLGDESHAELLDPSGTTIADARIPTSDPDQLVFELDEALGPGEYEVQWTVIGQDGHVSRDTFTITVLEPEPSPTPAPTATAAPSASSTPTDAPSAAPPPSPAPSADGTPAAGTNDVLFPILAAVIALAALGAMLLRNRRNRQA